MTQNLKESLVSCADRMFILDYNQRFNKFLQNLDQPARELIRKHKPLDDLFDLVLDYILDSSQHLDYHDTKQTSKSLTNDSFNI